jgi:ubiquinone/menaquinone biosynthesis C-methylase UbiE
MIPLFPPGGSQVVTCPVAPSNRARRLADISPTRRRAWSYDRRWHHFTQRTLKETLATIDVKTIEQSAQEHHRAPRLLDVACGTEVLLSLLHEQFPDAEFSGVDGSRDMLLQAHQRLAAVSSLRLEQAIIGPDEQAGLLFPPDSFDLITCTNALHNLADPMNTIAGFRRLLTPAGQLVMEDYARRSPAIPWRIVEWLALRIEGSQGRALSLPEAERLCEQAGVRVERSHAFPIDVVFHGWVLAATKTGSESPPHSPS